MNEPIQVTPSAIDPVAVGVRLTDARRARGMTQQQVADALGVARTTVTAMEKGDRRPRADELVRLAGLFGRHVSDLTRPLPVRRPESFVVQFRGARGVAAGDDPKTASDIAVFQELCEDYVELERITDSPLPQREPPVYDIRGADPERAGEEVATSERLRLGLGDGPIGDFWGMLEADLGVRLFAPSFAGANAGMFVYSAEYGGCIAVSGNHPEERRRWSAAHEVAHFLVDRYKPEITVLPGRRLPDGERFADAFARNVLMPGSGLTRQFRAIERAKEGPITPVDILGLCRRYGASFLAMMLRLEDLRLLAPGTLDRLNGKGFKPDAARAALGMPPTNTELRLLPLRFELLAIQAFEQEKLSEGQLARFLRLDRVRARERVAELTQPAPDYADGAWRQAPLDLAAPLVGR